MLRQVCPDISKPELRVLLSYLHDFGEKDHDEKLSIAELLAVVKPFSGLPM